MTQSNRVDSAESVQLTRLLQCCMKLCNNEGGYTRPLVTARLRQYTAVRALEVRMRLVQLRGHGSLSAYTCVCPSIHLSASNDNELLYS